jgi:hypothetical protein
VVYQRPAVPSPAAITAETFHAHLGQSEWVFVCTFSLMLSTDDTTGIWQLL